MPPRLARAVLGAAASASALLACGFDWTVREAPGPPAIDGGDAAAAADALPAEAGGDAAPPADGATPDGSGGPDCAALADDLDAKKKAARACKLSSGECTTTTKDQCGCDVFVAVAGSSAVIKYQEAVTTFQGTACPQGCAPSCPPPPMFAPTCLTQAGTNLCYP